MASRRMRPVEFDCEWNAGAKLSFEAAVEYALESLAAVERQERLGEAPTVAGSDSTAVLLERCQKGDGQAREQLARRILPVLSRWAHGRLPAKARGMIDTDDLVQETVVRAFRRLEGFEAKGEGALVAYLRTAVLNRIRDAARHAARRPGQKPIEELIDEGPSPLQEVIGRSSFETYEEALSELPEVQRQSI